MEALAKASHKLAEEIYKEQAAKQQQTGSATDASKQGQSDAQAPGNDQNEQTQDNKDDVVDAEYKEDKRK